MTTSSSLGSASASMHPTVSPTSSNDSDFSVASLADGLPLAKSGSGNERDEGYNEDPVSRALRRYSLSLAQYTADRFEESENAALAEEEGVAASTAMSNSTAQDHEKRSKCEKSQRSERDAAAALSRGMPSTSTSAGGRKP